MLLVLGLIAVGTTAGFIVGRESGSPSVSPLPAGHSGVGLPAHEFGDPVRGARLFVSKGCADCHSYGGKGGTDAQPDPAKRKRMTQARRTREASETNVRRRMVAPSTSAPSSCAKNAARTGRENACGLGYGSRSDNERPPHGGTGPRLRHS